MFGESSPSLSFLDNHTGVQYGKVLILLAQIALLGLVCAHIRSSHLLHGKFPELFEYLGARFLKSTAWMCLWMLIVYSLVTTCWRLKCPPSPHPSREPFCQPWLERKSPRYCGRGKAGRKHGRNLFVFFFFLMWHKTYFNFCKSQCNYLYNESLERDDVKRLPSYVLELCVSRAISTPSKIFFLTKLLFIGNLQLLKHIHIHCLIKSLHQTYEVDFITCS